MFPAKSRKQRIQVATKKDCHHCRADSYAYAYPLKTTAWFKTIADVHPLVEGHILIIPRQHISCIGALPKNQFKGFGEEYRHVKEFLNREYGSFAAFEHGVIGQTIHHAHFHLLPYGGKASQIVPEKKRIFPINSIGDLPKIFKRDGHYLFFALGEKSYLVDPAIGKRGVFRHRFATALGKPDRAQQPQNPNLTYTGTLTPDDLMAQFKNDAQKLQQCWQAWTTQL